MILATSTYPILGHARTFRHYLWHGVPWNIGLGIARRLGVCYGTLHRRRERQSRRVASHIATRMSSPVQDAQRGSGGPCTPVPKISLMRKPCSKLHRGACVSILNLGFCSSQPAPSVYYALCDLAKETARRSRSTKLQPDIQTGRDDQQDAKDTSKDDLWLTSWLAAQPAFCLTLPCMSHRKIKGVISV